MYCVIYHGVSFPVRRAEMTIGRSPYSAIVIVSPSVSRDHARLRMVDGALTIADLGSSNGTTVNGMRVEGERTLVAGDVVGLGPEMLLVSLEFVSPAAQTQNGARETLLELKATERTVMPNIEIVERLAANAAVAPDPLAVAGEVRRLIDWLVRDAVTTPNQGGRIRLMAAAEIIASWAKKGELEEWRRAIAAQLGFANP